MINSLTKQRGVYSIEFSIIGLVMGVLLVFTFDVVVKQSVKGKLDRLSYSAVSLLKERTQLYNESDVISPSEIDQLSLIVTESLGRTWSNFEQSNFGIRFEQQKFVDGVAIVPVEDTHLFSRGDVGCTPEIALNELTHLSPETTFGRRATLYQITICYLSDNWIGELLSSNFRLVRSHSIMVGR
ncbi:pilus assembly protein TadF [Parasalinivibrio latis]|uniref:tight adherence pilus pseudopilin TadF n=1 Tax=Parasalinivibrio latis TaxID=2952610 RepID=UPI0030DFF019